MSVIASSLRNLSTFLQDYQASFSNGLLILFTIGGEQIFSVSAFKCPCHQPDAYYYAVIFMLLPALILLLLGVIVSNLTWRLLHGCGRRSQKSQNGFKNTCGYLFMVSARAAIVPFAWLFIALLDGKYYACMQAEKPCDLNSDKYKTLQAESQIISWMSLAVLIVLSFIVICVARCCDSVTYVQYKYLSSYRDAEQIQWDAVIQENTKTLAESNVKAFMQESQFSKKDWDEISKVPDTTIPVKGIGDEGDHPNDPEGQKRVFKVFLTPLHEWANKAKVEQGQGDQMQMQC